MYVFCWTHLVLLPFLARPVDKATINHLIHIGKILSNELNPSTDENDNAIRRQMIKSISIKPGMSENELAVCIGKTILSTARQIIAKKYPDPTTTFANVDREHVRPVAGRDAPVRSDWVPVRLGIQSDWVPVRLGTQSRLGDRSDWVSLTYKYLIS